MSKVILENGVPFVAASKVSVLGTTGNDIVKVLDFAGTEVTSDASIERVEFARPSTGYTYKATSTGVQVLLNGTVVSNLVNNQKLAFTDGSATVTTEFNPATASVVVKLGGVVVPTTAGAVAFTPNNAAGEASTITTGSGGTGSTTGQAFSLTATAETKTLTSGNDTVDGSLANSINNDIIVDASTTDSDVLNAKVTTTAQTATISNVEKINLDFAGFNLAFNAASVSNGTIVASTTQEFNDKATITGLASNNVNVEVGAGIKNLTLTATTANTGTANVKLAGGDLSLTNGANGVKTLGINSTGSGANIVTLSTSTAAETFNVTGDKDLTVKVGQTQITGDTVSKTLTGTAKANLVVSASAAADLDLKKVVVDTFDFAAASVASGSTATFASGTTNLSTSVVNAIGGTVAADGSATTDVLNLTLNKSQSGLTTSGFETVNLTNNTGAALELGATNVSATGALKVAATDKALTISTLTAKTFDASAVSAAVTITTVAAAETVNTGSGADNITVTAITGVAINVGDGANTVTGSTGADTIIAGAGNDTINASNGADYVVSGAGNDIITIGSNSAVINAGAGDDKVVVSAALSSTVTLIGGDGTDILNITAAGTHDFSASGVSFLGFESAVVDSSSAAITIKFQDANVTANSTFKFEVAGTQTGTVSFDGSSELDGLFNIVSGAGSDSLTGGAGKDTIVAGGGSDAVTGGKGADSINLTETTPARDTVKFASGDSTYTAWDQVTGFAIGSSTTNDLLDLVGTAAAGSSSDLVGTAVSGSNSGIVTFTDTNLTLDGKIAAVGAAVKTQYATVAFEHAGSTYVFQNVDATASAGALTANDIVVQLVGVTGVTELGSTGSTSLLIS